MPQAAGTRELMEERPQDRGAQVPDRGPPVEALGRTCSTGPQHPGGEQAVEQGLHQGRAEEGLAARALEANPQGLLEGGAHRLQRLCVAGGLDPRQPVAGVRRQQPGEVPRLGQRGAVRQRPAQVLGQAGANVAGEDVRRLQTLLELLGALRQPEGLEPGGKARRVLPDEHEVAGVGHQHETIAVPVAADLSAVRGQPGVVVRGLHLHHAALRCLPRPGLPLLHLPRRIEPEVGVARSLVGQLADAEHLGLEGAADGVEQVGQRPVAGALPRGAAGGADSVQVREVVLDCRRQAGRPGGHDGDLSE